jgi:hypothetical protein
VGLLVHYLLGHAQQRSASGTVKAVKPALPSRRKAVNRSPAESVMTEIAFHFNAPDKLAYACRFARKALRSGARLVITGSAHAG